MGATPGSYLTNYEAVCEIATAEGLKGQGQDQSPERAGRLRGVHCHNVNAHTG